MATNPSRETGPEDRWSDDARQDDEYWLCECGVARSSADSIQGHLDKEGHFAERIDTTDGTVTGFMAGGLDDPKYRGSIPDTAQIPRRKNKNEPLFEDPEY